MLSSHSVVSSDGCREPSCIIPAGGSAVSRLCLVVPCWNEAEMLPISLPRMLEELDAVEKAEEGLKTTIFIADDGSTDATAQVTQAYPDKRVQLLSLPHSGQQGALLAGLRAAVTQGADAVITLDADLQDDPGAIPEMVRQWRCGKEVVYGVRSSRGDDSAFKKASAWFFYALMHLFDRRHIMGHADFRLMGRRCVQALLEKASAEGDLIRNIVPTLGFEASCVYYARGERTAGDSKYGLAQMLSFSWKGLIAQAPFCMLLLSLFTFVAFFLTSVDSPTHDNMVAHGGYIRFDSAWYFMCGKAWVNGLTPYVDFSDSKGPLLWFFYALAYLISPRSWAGVFCINAAAYLLTACLLFKVSLLLTQSSRKSLWIGMMLNVVYFLPIFIYDDKSEALALPFVALAMLMACRSLYGKGGSFFWWGFSAGAILLIKYSIAPMTGIFLIVMLSQLRSWKAVWRAVGATLGGLSVIVLPILLYLLYCGALNAFVNDYFLTTFTTINNILGSNDKGEFFRSEMVAYDVLAVAGVLTAAFALRQKKWFPPVALIWFLLCLSRYTRTYYFIPVNVLMVFTAFGILRCFEKDFGIKRFLFGPLLLVAIIYCAYKNAWTYRQDYFYGREMNLYRERAWECVDFLATEKHPRVLYWGCGEHGFGIKAEDLPACKYWAIQTGATAEMFENQNDAVRNRQADYVFVETLDRNRQNLLEAFGYTRCPHPEFGRHRLFKKQSDWNDNY